MYIYIYVLYFFTYFIFLLLLYFNSLTTLLTWFQINEDFAVLQSLSIYWNDPVKCNINVRMNDSNSSLPSSQAES